MLLATIAGINVFYLKNLSQKFFIMNNYIDNQNFFGTIHSKIIARSKHFSVLKFISFDQQFSQKIENRVFGVFSNLVKVFSPFTLLFKFYYFQKLMNI